MVFTASLASALPAHFAGHHSGSVGSAGSPRLLPGTPHQHTPPHPLVNPQHQSAAEKAVYKRAMSRSISKQAFSSGKEGWSFPLAVNLKPPNQLKTHGKFY